MPTTTRDRVDEIRALEKLWAAPAAAEPLAPLQPKAQRWSVPSVSGQLVAAGWVAFFTIALLFEPAAEPGAVIPAWAIGVFLAQLALLVGGGWIGFASDRVGFAAATLAGPLGMAVAVECRAAAHHLGNWWLAELGATAALTAIAAVGLVQRLRR